MEEIDIFRSHFLVSVSVMYINKNDPYLNLDALGIEEIEFTVF